MNLNDGKYLLEIYQHCKDFQNFFMNHDYQESLKSLLHILSPIVSLHNIIGIIQSDDQNYYLYSAIHTDDNLKQETLKIVNTHKNQSQNDLLSLYCQYGQILIYPLEKEKLFLGYLIFYKDMKSPCFSQDEKICIQQITKIYTDLFMNQHERDHLFNQSIFEKILDNIKANILITRPQTDEILYINDQMKETYQLQNPVGQTCWKVIQRSMNRRCRQCPIELLLKNPTECYLWEEVSSFNNHVYQNYDSLIEWVDHTLVHFQYSVDITDFKQLTYEAYYDELTGIYNRKAGKRETIQTLLKAKNEKKFLVMCLLDIDHLKHTNDTYGHIVGDELLLRVATTIKERLQPEDIFFRLSGDEFVICFYNKKTSDAHTFMQDTLKTLDTIRITEKIPYYLNFCYGLYEISPDSNMSLNEIITHADEKMYSYKKNTHFKRAIDQLKNDSAVHQPFDYNKDLLYDALVKSTDDYIFICNMKTNTFQYTPAMVDEFEFPSEVLTNAAAIFGTKIHPDDKYEFLNSNQLIADGKTDSHFVEYRALNKNKEYVWLRCHGHVEYDENGEPSLFAGFISNLGKRNYRDSLTGLFNKFEFEKQINEMIGDFAIMILNISDFKNINQLYNREFGDTILRIVGQNLQTRLYKESTVFKLDGDEFGLILKNTDEEYLHHLFETITSYSSIEHIYENKPFVCYFNAGCAYFPRDGNNYLELRKNCEIALQYSKHYAEHKLVIYDVELLKEKTYTLQLMSLLKQDIYNLFEHFSLVFQPKVLSRTHELIGFETLCRWEHPDFPDVGPDIFIPLLENSGDIIVLGKWIFEQSLIQLKKLITYNPHIAMSINVSYVQFTEEQFISFVEDMLQKHNIPPHQIIIELTETSIAKNTQLVIHAIKHFRSLGIRIAMDDFGKGYSSLSLLKDEPLDIIKIDRSFVKDIKYNAFNSTFMKMMIELCHQIQLKVVVEGVETKDELEIIEAFHPDYIQGYYTGKPMNDHDCIQLIIKNNIDK